MKKEEGGGWGIVRVFEAIAGSVQAFVGSMIQTVTSEAEEAVNRIARRAFFFIFGVFGLWFLLHGFSELLDFLYAVPGMGEMFVGALVVVIALLLWVGGKK